MRPSRGLLDISPSGRCGPAASRGSAPRERVRGAPSWAALLAPTWTAVVDRALGGRWKLNLSCTASFRRCAQRAEAEGDPGKDKLTYHNFGAAVSEVEVDVLTGQTTIVRTDILYDCGKSLNPAVDLGQAEGGFMQGVGFYLREDLITTPEGLGGEGREERTKFTDAGLFLTR